MCFKKTSFVAAKFEFHMILLCFTIVLWFFLALGLYETQEMARFGTGILICQPLI